MPNMIQFPTSAMDWLDLLMLLLAVMSAVAAIHYGQKLHRPFLTAKAVPFLWFAVYYALGLTDKAVDVIDAHVVLMRPALAILLIFFLIDTAHDRIARFMARLVHRLRL